eukprot:1162761-Amphidinium_carterae.1
MAGSLAARSRARSNESLRSKPPIYTTAHALLVAKAQQQQTPSTPTAEQLSNESDQQQYLSLASLACQCHLSFAQSLKLKVAVEANVQLEH